MVRKSRNLPRRIALQKDSAVGKQTARKWGDSRALFVSVTGTARSNRKWACAPAQGSYGPMSQVHTFSMLP